ncbi:hypothetical protein SAMN04489860_1977 [Paraoerskovia marina]|uniref:Cell division protein FtsL n=2 Tax=Paraoerskovia marina TaxID=545619 RepID=A0A1H1TRZ1_9CELL|nr:hypothetical protein SAMN04489860_1977 [Paraoerskovia marina]
MSMSRATAPLTSAAPIAAPRPRLQLVRTPDQARSRGPFIVLCMSILGGALLCGLLLSTTMVSGSFEMRTLQRELGAVAQDTQDLQMDVDSASASLHERATALGMVPAEDPVMVTLSGSAPAAQDVEGASESP